MREVIEALGLAMWVESASMVFLFSLGMVYLCGRMLFLVKTPVGKNRIAAIAIFLSAAMFSVDVIYKVIPQWVRQFFCLIGIGCVLYTLVGMRLFGRADKLLDKKIAPDEFDDEGIVKKKGKK